LTFSNEIQIRAASIPTQPLSVVNDPVVTAAGVIGITWSPPSSNGGSPVIDYQVSYKTGTAQFSVLATGITTTSYTASSLAVNVIYTFKVTARNLVGLGADSSEVSIRAAAVPSAPAAPSTAVNSNVSVTISWTTPFNGGNPISAYTVAIRQNDGTTYTIESASCAVSATSCTVPISVLQAAPYNLPWGASVWAKVVAINVVGSSD